MWLLLGFYCPCRSPPRKHRHARRAFLILIASLLKYIFIAIRRGSTTGKGKRSGRGRGRAQRRIHHPIFVAGTYCSGSVCYTNSERGAVQKERLVRNLVSSARAIEKQYTALPILFFLRFAFDMKKTCTDGTDRLTLRKAVVSNERIEA